MEKVEYSFVLFDDSKEIVLKSELIYGLLNQGIKVLLFTNDQVEFNIPEHKLMAFKKAKLFEVMVNGEAQMEETISIIDGQSQDCLNKCACHHPNYIKLYAE